MMIFAIISLRVRTIRPDRMKYSGLNHILPNFCKHASHHLRIVNRSADLSKASVRYLIE